MYTLTITANTIEELFAQLNLPVQRRVTETPVEEPMPQPEEIKPVLTQAQMEENIANAPKHEMPPQPTLEEVRAVLKELRDRKGSAAVKEILSGYGAGSLQELKPEDYLGAIDRARAEV